MNKLKIVKLVYFIALAISGILLLRTSLTINNLIAAGTTDNLYNTYSNLQRIAGIRGIVSFIVLLLVSLILYYLSSKRTYIILTNIMYIGLVLYVFITANQNYFSAQNIDYSQKSEYWLTVFMGIFYILGAVLVSAIGYITVRNYAKRANHTIKKSS